MPQVEFHILQGSAPAARLKFACQLIDEAYRAGERVLIRLADAQEVDALDALLWTFADGAFVPHDRVVDDAAASAPVMLFAGDPPPALAHYGVLFDLALAGEPVQTPPERVVEIIDADETRRHLGRDRFRSYRERGWLPTTHKHETQAANG
jgi:DNA polymerase III subunit chi